MSLTLLNLVGSKVCFQESDDPNHPPTGDNVRFTSNAIILSDSTRKGRRVLVTSPIAIYMTDGERAAVVPQVGNLQQPPTHTSVFQHPTLVDQGNNIWKMIAKEDGQMHSFLGTLMVIS